MSDDAQTPEAPEVSGESGVSAESGGSAVWGDVAAGGTRASFEKGPSVSFDKNGGASSSGPSVPSAPEGPGYTLASQEPPAWPAPSVHDQQTVTSMPPTGAPAEPRDAVPPASRDAVPPASPWMNPSAGPGPAMPPNASTANPFAPPGPTSPAPLGSPANPFAAPTAPRPYAAHGEPVPPPPVGPDGPGQVPYGYPGGHGYPPAHLGAGYYGWPGVQAMPSNGMGTAGLVLGIISAVIFCLWPLAIILGVLALIFGTIGRSKARRGEATNPGQALAGVICGAAGVVLGLVMLALLIATS